MAADRDPSYNSYLAGELAKAHRARAKYYTVGPLYRLLGDYDMVKRDEASEQAHLKVATAYEELNHQLWRCAGSKDCETVVAELARLIDCDKQRDYDFTAWQEKRCWRINKQA